MTVNDWDREARPTDAALHRFVDGALTPEERIAVEGLLAGSTDAYDEVCAYQRQNVLLQALHPQREEDEMLPASAIGLAVGLRRARTFRRVASASMAGLALMVASTAGWYAQGWMGDEKSAPVVAVFPSGASQSAPTMSATAASTGPQLSSAVSSGPAGQLDLVNDGAEQVSVHPPNLQSVGYQLVDGRADLTAYGPVIRFAYEPTDGVEGDRLALTVAAFGLDRQSLATSINPQHTSLFWQSGPLFYALSGAVKPGSLLGVAEAMVVIDGAAEAGSAAAQPSSVTELPAESPVLPVQPAVDVVDHPKDT